MIHERASGIVSHSITSGKESPGKPHEQEYLARVCIIPVRRLGYGARRRSLRKNEPREIFSPFLANNEGKHETLRSRGNYQSSVSTSGRNNAGRAKIIRAFSPRDWKEKRARKSDVLRKQTRNFLRANYAHVEAQSSRIRRSNGFIAIVIL